jgi:predicted nucleic acid-binding protein
MRVLLDTNIILDIAQEREPFFATAVRILDASDFDQFHLFITASSATDIYYLLRKSDSREAALAFLSELLETIDVCLVDKNVLSNALGSPFLDFEDAVQNAAAIQSQIEIIVTRNKADYENSQLKVLTPEEFVTIHLP